MLIFILNAGSSSLKYQLMNPISKEVLASGLCERIGIDGRVIHEANDQKIKEETSLPTHKEAISFVLDLLTKSENKVIDSIDKIDAIGHRVVHGGEYFNKSVIIDNDVLAKLEELIPLAPLHNPAHILGIKICMELMIGKPNIAVFDTAFHQTMPSANYMYALPYEDYKDHKVRKYGFHGTSHYYVSNEAIKLLNNKKDSKVIVCHLGNGSSVCAVKDGKSFDTSMGLTPLEGLVMGTRCGDLDPTCITYLRIKKELGVSEIIDYLNKKSGLLGVSGISSDLREIIEASQNGNERASLAIDMKCNRIKKYICAYAGAMGGVDAICFTAGIGENADLIREKVCSNLKFMGIELDLEKNKIRNSEAREINKKSSNVKIFVIPTNEELVIATDTYNLINA